MKTFIHFLAVITCICTAGFASAQTNTTNKTVLSVQAENGELLLEWTTQREVNTSFFLIERSSDNQHFTLVKMVKAAGHTTFPHTYSCTEAIEDSASYYRVTVVTMNGEQISSAPVYPEGVVPVSNMAVK